MAILSPGAGGIAGIAAKVGKPGRQQKLGNPSYPARSTITGGSPLAHSMNHFGKVPPPMPAMLIPSDGMGGAGVDPTAHAGMSQVRGGSGGIKRNPRSGGIGPSKMGGVGAAPPKTMSSSPTSKDVE